MKEERKRLTRREALGLIGGAASAAAIAATVGCSSDSSTPSGTAASKPASASPSPSPSAAATSAATATQAAATAAPAVACVVTPAETEGPYFVDEKLNRSDIRSDPATGVVKEGVPLELTLFVSQVGSSGCTPLAGALVDVWHCDALGVYSDVANGAGQASTSGQKFLRGYQTTDANGQVKFQTIFPGWYMGRTVHIHFKVRTDPASAQGFEFTSQLFFDEPVTGAVFAQAPYSTKGPQDTTNARDSIFSPDLILPVTAQSSGYAGTYHIGVNLA